MKKTIAYISSILLIAAIAVLVSARLLMSQSDTKMETTAEGSSMKSPGTFGYDAYAGVLKKYVDDQGMVNYSGLKADRKGLDSFVAMLGSIDKEDFKGWSDNRKIAFWINAYNALTLQTIIDNYPIQSSFVTSLLYPDNSIRQIDGAWTDRTHEVRGSKMSLDEIEHMNLRAKFNEPRVHMALVCAAVGCPPLRNEPYTAERLGEQLDDQAKKFLSNPAKFRIDRKEGTVYLSPIFKWFGSDFVKNYGTEKFAGHDKTERAVLNFVSGYLSGSDREYLMTSTYDLEYLDYDWSLNERK